MEQGQRVMLSGAGEATARLPVKPRIEPRLETEAEVYRALVLGALYHPPSAPRDIIHPAP